MRRSFTNTMRNCLTYALGGVVLGWVLLVNFGILTRYVFKVSLPWNDEITVLIFTWVIFFGTALASIQDDHIEISILREALHGRAKTIVGICQHLGFMVFIGIACFQSWKICLLQARTEQTSAVLKIPVYLTTLAMGVCGVLWFLFVAARIYRLSRELSRREGARP